MSNGTQPLLSFFGALERVVFQGARITRKEWHDTFIYGFLNEGRLRLHLSDGLLHDWIISDGDLTADDWEVLT